MATVFCCIWGGGGGKEKEREEEKIFIKGIFMIDCLSKGQTVNVKSNLLCLLKDELKEKQVFSFSRPMRLLREEY